MGTPTIVAAGPVLPFTTVPTALGGSLTTRQFNYFVSPSNALNVGDNGGLFFIEVTGVPLSVLTITLSQSSTTPPAATYLHPLGGINNFCNLGAIGGTTINNGVTTIRPSSVTVTTSPYLSLVTFTCSVMIGLMYRKSIKR